MVKSVWEEASPEARTGLRNIQQHIGADVGKRTGPGSPGYIAQGSFAPKRQASIGRRLEAQTRKDIAAGDRSMQMDLQQNKFLQQMDLQQNKFAQEDKDWTRSLADGISGKRSGGRRSSGLRGMADDSWKYGGKDPVTGLPTYRTNASGMQLYNPEEMDKKTGVTTPGRFGETIGGASVPTVPDMPDVPEEGTGTVRDRPGSQPYSQNIFQRKEKRRDGSDRFVFTNIGTPDFVRGDVDITDDKGNYDRSRMVLDDKISPQMAKMAATDRLLSEAKNLSTRQREIDSFDPDVAFAPSNQTTPKGLSELLSTAKATPLNELEGYSDKPKSFGTLFGEATGKVAGEMSQGLVVEPLKKLDTSIRSFGKQQPQKPKYKLVNNKWVMSK